MWPIKFTECIHGHSFNFFTTSYFVIVTKFSRWDPWTSMLSRALPYNPQIFLLFSFWAAGRRPYIVFTFTGSVRNVRNDVNIYIHIYIYIYVNNMADAKSVRNLLAIFR